MNDKLARLAGELHLHPGTASAIRGGRPDAARLAIGRPADELPALLGALFTLCSHAHRMTARHAVSAARGDAAAPTAAERETLRLATARDQLLRIAHDWPRQLDPLARGRDAGMDLPSCPLWHAEAPDAARLALLPDWLADHWLGMAPEAWLARLQDDPDRWAAQWAQRAPGPLAALLRGVLPLAEATPAAGPAWRPLGDPLPAMTSTAGALAARSSPWPAGVVPDTGPWSRQGDSLRASAQNAWMRLASRLVDLLHLATPGGDAWLAQGRAAAAWPPGHRLVRDGARPACALGGAGRSR